MNMKRRRSDETFSSIDRIPSTFTIQMNSFNGYSFSWKRLQSQLILIVMILNVLSSSVILGVKAFSTHHFHSNYSELARIKNKANILSNSKAFMTKESSDEGIERGKKKGSQNGKRDDDKTKEEKPKQKRPPKNSGNIISLLSNPYKAGKQFRQTLDSVLKSASTLSPERKAIYYLDDRFLDDTDVITPDSGFDSTLSEGALAFAQRGPLVDGMGDEWPLLDGTFDDDDYIPEVLVIGATGAIGRLVVRRMLLSGKFRVRVLVRDLYSNTLNLLGTGVTYCQGDLRNIESLEYAVTDVDKIVFCAGPPRQDEEDYTSKFQDFVEENLDIEVLSDSMELRAQLAQQVDELGMQNIVRAYQNVRHADYGTSQAAKRSLFRFEDREEDYNLFTINIDDESSNGIGKSDSDKDLCNQKSSSSASFKSQVTWMKNKFNHGVFVGKLPTALNADVGSEASIISSRLRSREDPNQGTDLSNGFAGFVCRVCADGKSYQAFIRTSDYETKGIEYVCKFDTVTKSPGSGNKSLNKFQTIRLPFVNFKPTSKAGVDIDLSGVKPFDGRDLKQLGFRVDSADNIAHSLDQNQRKYKWMPFYLALCYIKVYRSQPEPEFVYLSDARLPATVSNEMVRHDLRRIVSVAGGDEKAGALFDEEEAKRVLQDPKDRSGEELYYKYRGEEILKNSGLQYSIIRIPSLNELPSGEFSTIQLKQSNDSLTAVSRAEVAAVCVSALLDPHARNVCFYMSKAKETRVMSIDEKISTQFESLTPEI